MRRMLWSLLIIAMLAYGCVLGLLLLFQDRLVYFPQIGRELWLDPREHGLEHTALTLATVDGEKLDAWFFPAGQADAVVLILHGNAGNMSHRVDTVAMFHRMGYSVLIFDYRGYGRSTGRPSETGLYHDAMAAWDHLTRQRGFPPGQIILFGESLGGAVAAWLAARERPAALILSSVFTSAPDLAAELYPWLPTRWLLRVRYDTRAALVQLQCPVLIAHSPDDDIIPFGHGQRLLEAASEPKTFLQLAGSHNEGFIFMRPAWVAALDDFLRRHRQERSTP
ncbi:MAG: alpha/beta hydrolase [Gammaproteobacteria bacterium]